MRRSLLWRNHNLKYKISKLTNFLSFLWSDKVIPSTSLNRTLPLTLFWTNDCFQARELVLSCCTEFIHLVSSESNEVKKSKNNIYQYINLACLLVCLYPINVKTAEPIGSKFFVGHLGTPGKVYEWSKFQIFVSIKIRSPLNFLKFWKSTKFFVKIRELFLVCFTMYTKRTCSQLI